MNVVAICGLEQCPDGIRWSDTFLNNIKTWKRHHASDNLVIVDARDYVDCSDPMASLWRDVKKAHDVTDLVIYSGHSSPINLLVFYHCQTDLDNSKRYIGVKLPWDMPLSDKAEIILWGCQTAGVKGTQSENSIAQAIANNSKRPTWGFVWRSSQKLKDGGFYQTPEHGGLVECKPE